MGIRAGTGILILLVAAAAPGLARADEAQVLENLKAVCVKAGSTDASCAAVRRELDQNQSFSSDKAVANKVIKTLMKGGSPLAAFLSIVFEPSKANVGGSWDDFQRKTLTLPQRKQHAAALLKNPPTAFAKELSNRGEPWAREFVTVMSAQ